MRTKIIFELADEAMFKENGERKFLFAEDELLEFVRNILGSQDEIHDAGTSDYRDNDIW